MADDMANGSSDDTMRTYSDAVQAALGERVTNMGRRINDVEVEMRAGFNQVSNSLSASTNETRQSIAALSASLADRARPQWQALSVMLAFAAILGGLAYMPIREATSDLKLAVASLAENTVSRQEMDWRTQRGQEDRITTLAAITDIRAGLVPRQEHERVWANFDQRFADQQRQIDEVKAAQNSVYNQRDVVRDILERLDRAEHRAPTPP